LILKNPFKIHYLHHVAFAVGRLRGAWARRRFVRRLAAGAWHPTQDRVAHKALPFALVTLAGEKSFPEAVVMLDSFFAHAGKPASCEVISDGTLTSRHQEILRRIHPQITIKSLEEFLGAPLPGSLEKRLPQNPMMIKLAIMLGVGRLPNGFYVDSDFMFFRSARAFNWTSLLEARVPRYMRDTGLSLDRRLLRPDEVGASSANAGLVLFGRPLDLEPWLDRLELLGDQLPGHFSEQTLVHLALLRADSLPLDPGKFILALDDLFSFRDKYAFRPDVVCRHYTGTIRHKFWILTGQL